MTSGTAFRRAVSAALVRRFEAAQVAVATPDTSIESSGTGLRPELAIVKENSTFLMTRLENLEQERRVALPLSTIRTFRIGDVSIVGYNSHRHDPRMTRADVKGLQMNAAKTMGGGRAR